MKLLNLSGKAIAEKEQFRSDKENNDQKLETVLFEFNETMSKEKKKIFENFETQMKNISDQVKYKILFRF